MPYKGAREARGTLEKFHFTNTISLKIASQKVNR